MSTKQIVSNTDEEIQRMCDVVDEHSSKYYHRLVESDISDSEFIKRLTETYNQIVDSNRR
jgi:phage protein D